MWIWCRRVRFMFRRRGSDAKGSAGQRPRIDTEASQTRDYCVAKNATLRAARPDPSLRKERLLGMTIALNATGGQECPPHNYLTG
jgi:hypothetical protein